MQYIQYFQYSRTHWQSATAGVGSIASFAAFINISTSKLNWKIISQNFQQTLWLFSPFVVVLSCCFVVVRTVSLSKHKYKYFSNDQQHFDVGRQEKQTAKRQKNISFLWPTGPLQVSNCLFSVAASSCRCCCIFSEIVTLNWTFCCCAVLQLHVAFNIQLLTVRLVRWCCRVPLKLQLCHCNATLIGQSQTRQQLQQQQQ